MAVAAAERRLKISTVYEEAATEYLKSRPPGATKSDDAMTAPLTQSKDVWPEGAAAAILKKLDNCQHFIQEINANTAGLIPMVDARALAVVIAALAKAGQEGIGTPEVRTLLNRSAFTNIKTTIVRDVLVRAGVASYADGRLFMTDVGAATIDRPV
ncbi:hypothetical protein AFCDBAGC_0181 [Methylobacterium cerastii]|uniref:Uncharacterized protein n=3 Tax=Methylobacterium TaxID=407 RepID=A0ABQ4U4D9_9HYPH|nr:MULTISPECIES: hypothetical protein [Methylobacterium]TXM79408.1 hypothetical protein FV218_00520 [Methylobacterium sp. WL69]TXN23640.1 hypothetical protein FV220_20935 [Methylobacterium sp. WL19]GJD42345.1 hypothetical protein AFCDBAGC_0181 [Methylobacterium cerastii]GJE62311.1 hypothetical protein MPOCJGCO_4444 [Methylobacterium trifolii]